MTFKWLDAMQPGATDQDQVMRLTDNLLALADEIDANCNFYYYSTIANGVRCILLDLRSGSQIMWCGEMLGRALPIARAMFHPASEKFQTFHNFLKLYNGVVEMENYERKRRGEQEVYKPVNYAGS